MVLKIFSCFGGSDQEGHKKAGNYHERGYELFKAGRYKEALEMYTKEINILKSELGEMSIETAKCYVDIGEVYSCLSQYKEALYHYKKSLKYFKKTWGEGHVFVTRIYCNIGLVYYHQGDPIKSLEYYQKAMEIRINYLKKGIGSKTLIQHDIQIATISNLRGWVYDSMGKHSEALKEYKKALKCYLTQLGEIHPDIASLYNNIGLTYLSQGKLEKALDVYMKALKIFEETLGLNHPRIATAYNNIGAVLVELGRVDEAQEFLQRALDIDLAHLGKDHPNLIKGHNNIASIYLYQKKFALALKHFGIALQIKHKNPAYSTIEIATAFDGCGCVNVFHNKYDEAINNYQKSIAIRTRTVKVKVTDSELIDYKRLAFELDKARDATASNHIDQI